MRFKLIIVTSLLPVISFAFEPLSALYVAGTAATSIGGYLYYNYFSCEKVECCKVPWIHESPVKDFSELYGQPLVVQYLSDILSRRTLHPEPKPLSISFHGPTGTGKTFLSSILSKIIFKKGINSTFVNFFSVGHHFPNPAKELEYHDTITKIILNKLSLCEKSIFIFDEFEKVPPAVVTALTPFIDHRGLVNGVGTGHATFIFLSNTGSKAIVSKTYELWKKEVNRNDFQLRDFENEIRLAVFNEDGAYKNSDLVKRDLIDAYVPFLPLEKHHIRLCIISEFWKVNKRKPTPDEVEKILADVRFAADVNNLYAETGCKKVSALTMRLSD